MMRKTSWFRWLFLLVLCGCNIGFAIHDVMSDVYTYSTFVSAIVGVFLLFVIMTSEPQ